MPWKLPLPAPDGSGALVVVLDLRVHEAQVEHSDGRTERIALTPHRPVGEVTREVLAAVRWLGGPVEINPMPQEVSWSTPLDDEAIRQRGEQLIKNNLHQSELYPDAWHPAVIRNPADTEADLAKVAGAKYS